MAFTIRNLSVLAYANGFTLWHYQAASDRLDQVGRPGFFDNVDGMLAAGDIVMVSATDGARILCIGGRAEGSITAHLIA